MTYEEYAKIRDEKNLSDAQVAKKAGIGRSTFSDWKSGRSKPKDEKMRKIAEALDIDYFDFVSIKHLSQTSPARKILTYTIKDKDLKKIIAIESEVENSLVDECIGKIRKMPEQTLEGLKNYLDFLLSQSPTEGSDKKT